VDGLSLDSPLRSPRRQDSRSQIYSGSRGIPELLAIWARGNHGCRWPNIHAVCGSTPWMPLVQTRSIPSRVYTTQSIATLEASESLVRPRGNGSRIICGNRQYWPTWRGFHGIFNCRRDWI